jgi:hypothetical protein
MAQKPEAAREQRSDVRRAASPRALRLGLGPESERGTAFAVWCVVVEWTQLYMAVLRPNLGRRSSYKLEAVKWREFKGTRV